MLATVGTDHHPFDRLVTWVDEWAARQDPQRVRCLVQSGTSTPARHAESFATLPYDDLAALLAQADVVVCHGGPGTIMECRAVGLRPVSVPRRAELGEHVDDHQVAFTRRVAPTGLVDLVESREALHACLDAALAEPDRQRSTNRSLGNVEAVSRIDRLVTDLLVGRSRRLAPSWRRR